MNSGQQSDVFWLLDNALLAFGCEHVTGPIIADMPHQSDPQHGYNTVITLGKNLLQPWCVHATVKVATTSKGRSAKGVSKGQKRPQHPANGQPAKRSSPQPQTRDICPMGARGEESERNLPPNLNFHAMAQCVGLPGLCFMCSRPNHEQGPFHCPRVAANMGYRAALNAFYGRRKAIREDMRKLGMDAALASTTCRVVGHPHQWPRL
jgi:hypothetical protein